MKKETSWGWSCAKLKFSSVLARKFVKFILFNYHIGFFSLCQHGIMFPISGSEKKKIVEQAEAEVVPSSSSVQFKLESDLVCLRFVKFNLD